MRWWLLALCSCQSSSFDHGQCDAMLACAAVVTPQGVAALEQGYGTNGSCWSDASSAANCRTACVNSLAMLHQAYPTEPACLGQANGSISADTACGDLAAAQCTQIANCSPLGLKLLYGDQSTCETRLKISCNSVLRDVGTDQTTDFVDACAMAFQAMSCTAAVNHAVPDACVVKPGPLADGSPCGDAGQCQSAYCKKGAVGDCGVCSQRTNSCVRNDDCQSGFVCSGAMTCVQRGMQGASCGTAQPCAYGLICDGTACVMPVAAGLSCTRGMFDPCDGDQGYFCDGNTLKCTAYGIAGSGQACGIVNQGFTVCSAEGICSNPAGGTCQAAAADGAFCDDTNGPGCQIPSSCVNSLCVAFDSSTCK